MKLKLDFIPPFFRNRYVVTSIIFLVWLFFFNPIDVFSLIKYRAELKELRQVKDKYEERIVVAKKSLEELTSNPEKLEKFAREEHLLHKDNEVVFYIDR